MAKANNLEIEAITEGARTATASLLAGWAHDGVLERCIDCAIRTAVDEWLVANADRIIEGSSVGISEKVI